MKQCLACSREVPDSETLCAQCAQKAAAAAGLPGTDVAPVPPAPVIAAAPPSTATEARRVAWLAGAALLAGAAGTYALLLTRGTSAATASTAATTAARPAPAVAVTPTAATGQQWTTENREYWLGGDRRGSAFELPADHTVSIWQGTFRPSLVVRCAAHQTDAFVFTGSAMTIEAQPGKTVTIAFDDEPTRTEKWPDSTDHDALFAPDGAAFAEHIARAHTLRFGYTPHNAQPVVAQFHVDGLAQLIAPIARACGRKN